jgi:Protein of unknown function (DUF2806)
LPRQQFSDEEVVALLPDKLPGERLIIKIWKTLADNGVGGLLSPWQTKRLGRARTEVRRNEILVLAQARHDAAEIAAGRKSIDKRGRLIDVKSAQGVPDERLIEATEHTAKPLPSETARLLEYVSAMRARREMDRAVNTAMIIAKAEEEAESMGDTSVSEEPVDPDWFARWRMNAEDIHDEEMQRLWARILAGETKEPGSFSLHTIDFIRRLSKFAASQIEKLAPFVCEREVFHGGDIDAQLAGKGVTFNNLLELQDLGVVSGVDAFGLVKKFTSRNSEDFFNVFRFRNKALIIRADDAAKVLEIPAYPVTKVGAEVMRLGKFAADDDYMLVVAKDVVSKGFKVEIGDVEQRDATSFTVNNLRPVD